MPRPKILKPGQVVYDIDTMAYVIFKAYSANEPDKACVFHNGETYWTRIRPLNRKELGLP